MRVWVRAASRCAASRGGVVRVRVWVCLHAVAKVVPELRAVLGEGDDLVAQLQDVGDVVLAHLGTHGDLGRVLHLELDLLGQDVREVEALARRAHAHLHEGLGVHLVVGHDLAQLGEVPAVPLAQPHGVRVELLVKVVQQADRLRRVGRVVRVRGW